MYRCNQISKGVQDETISAFQIRNITAGNNDEYIVLCDFDSQKELRDEALKDGNNVLNIVGKQYKSKYN